MELMFCRQLRRLKSFHALSPTLRFAARGANTARQLRSLVESPIGIEGYRQPPRQRNREPPDVAESKSN